MGWDKPIFPFSLPLTSEHPSAVPEQRGEKGLNAHRAEQRLSLTGDMAPSPPTSAGPGAIRALVGTLSQLPVTRWASAALPLRVHLAQGH